MTKLRLFLIFIVLSSLPVLLSAALVLVAGSGSQNADSPWLIVVAILWSPAWSAFVAIGLGIYVWKRGIRKSTLRHENLVLGSLVLAMVAGTYVPYSIWQARSSASLDSADADERAGREFIRHSSAVAERIAPPFDVFTNYRGIERNGVRRLAYSVFYVPVQEHSSIHVVLDIAAAAAGRTPRIVCILSSEQLEERRDGNFSDYERIC